MRYIFIYLIVLFSFLSCSSDDNGAGAFDICENFVEIPEVTMTDVTVEAIDDGDSYGYIITALVTNNTDTTSQGGQPVINVYANGIPFSSTGSGVCGFIPANSVCELDKYLSIDANENLDMSPTIACYYYEL